MTHITLTAPEVRAVLDGSKTQFRVRLKLPDCDEWHIDSSTLEEYGDRLLCNFRDAQAYDEVTWKHTQQLPYAPGDEVWVREACIIAPVGWTDSPINPRGPCRQEVAYLASDRGGYTREAAKDYGLPVRSPVTMPRWASRITLLVKSVRVERLQDISEADAIAEGCIPDDESLNPNHIGPAPSIFSCAWIARHGAASWDANPWVVAVEFERMG